MSLADGPNDTAPPDAAYTVRSRLDSIREDIMEVELTNAQVRALSEALIVLERAMRLPE